MEGGQVSNLGHGVCAKLMCLCLHLWKWSIIFSSILQIWLLTQICLRALIQTLPHFTDREIDSQFTQEVGGRVSPNWVLLHVDNWKCRHPDSHP